MKIVKVHVPSWARSLRNYKKTNQFANKHKIKVYNPDGTLNGYKMKSHVKYVPSNKHRKTSKRKASRRRSSGRRRH